MTGRILLAAGGSMVGLYGVFRLLELGWDNLVAAALWLAGGVVLHDAVLAPVTLAVCAVATVVLPARGRAPAAAALVVLGTVTLAAIPVLGRFGASADNPTLLDRDYTTGWLVVAAVAGLWAVGATVARRRSSPPQPPGS